jgi:hypothetical protein
MPDRVPGLFPARLGAQFAALPAEVRHVRSSQPIHLQSSATMTRGQVRGALLDFARVCQPQQRQWLLMSLLSPARKENFGGDDSAAQKCHHDSVAGRQITYCANA